MRIQKITCDNEYLITYNPHCLPREWRLSPAVWRDGREDGSLVKPGKYIVLDFLEGDFIWRSWMEKEEGEHHLHPSLCKGISAPLTNLIGQSLVTWPHIVAKEPGKCGF